MSIHTEEHLEIPIRGQQLYLSSRLALFWKEEALLVVSDVHLGKTGHFRRNGIALPKDINQNNLQRLDQLIEYYEPESLLFLGDLFHSEMNSEWKDFMKWREYYTRLPMYLTAGNHEHYPLQAYQDLGLIASADLIRPPFLLSHQLSSEHEEQDLLVISGHIHPSVMLKGKGRQRLRLPCFRLNERELLLPAFGSFTGTHPIKPNADDRIFVIAEGKIMEFNP